MGCATASPPSQPPLAEDKPAPAQIALASGKEAPRPLICQTYAPVGTRIPRKICRTREQWIFYLERDVRLFEDVWN